MIEINLPFTIAHVLTDGPKLCVFRADDEGGQRHRFVARDLPRPPAIGETWYIHGKREAHPCHGPQIRVESMSVMRPRGKLLAKLLAGQRFPGVGEATANKLWDAFGDTLIDVLNAGDAQPLLAVLSNDARSRAQVDTIMLEWPTVDAEPHIFEGFERLGVPARIASRLMMIYGTDALDVLHNDPYRLLAFSSWAVVDTIALKIGIKANDPIRLAAACEAALHNRLAHGDTLMSDSDLRQAAQKLLVDHNGSDPVEAASRLNAIRKRPNGWQAAGPALMEQAIAERIVDELASRSRKPTLLPLPTPGIDGVALNKEQSDAVTMALSCPISLLIGGAGTGKTTVLKAIHRAASSAGIPIEMMALSGRAALRMREATGAMARTIAGWLIGVAAGHVDLSGQPLIIIDEASMVDLGSLYRVMRAAPPGCRFLLVGDDGQLPPVGFGLTFHEMVAVDAIPRTVLTEVMRQAAETGIPAIAASIRDGHLPDLPAYSQEIETGVSIAACSDAEVVSTAAAIRRSIPGAQIVGSIKGDGKAHDGGTIAINAILHDAWASAKNLDPSTWLKGEPVIWTVNDYDLDLWNGSLGKVIGTSTEGLRIRFDEGDRTIADDLLAEHLEPAWAITTHKAQGSQFETVIIPITQSRILDRALIYTAITRAKARVILVGSLAVIRAAVSKSPHASRRKTWLRDAITTAIAAGNLNTA